MQMTAYQNYLENEILTADPMKLIVLSYRGALDAIAAARRHLAGRDIRARSREITRAVEIVAELNRSLDFKAGEDIAQQLTRIYEYVIDTLLKGNRSQTDQPLADAEQVLSTLLEGWQTCSDAIVTSLETRYEEASCSF